jgi:hypothetical protein
MDLQLHGNRRDHHAAFAPALPTTAQVSPLHLAVASSTAQAASPAYLGGPVRLLPQLHRPDQLDFNGARHRVSRRLLMQLAHEEVRMRFGDGAVRRHRGLREVGLRHSDADNTALAPSARKSPRA